MKTKIYLTLIALFVALTVSSQIEKGTWFLNGLNLVSFQSGKEKYTYDDYESETNLSSISVGPFIMNSNLSFGSSIPNINYGITDQLSGGISLMLTSMGMKDDEDKSTSSILMIGPSARYYLTKEKKFLPFAEGKVGIGSYSSKYGTNDSDKTSLSGWYLGTGATYFFLPKIGIDFTLGYQSLTSKDKNSTYNGKGKNSGINFGIGILVGF